MKIMRFSSYFFLVLGCSSPAVPLADTGRIDEVGGDGTTAVSVEQACADGQTAATSGVQDPQSLLSWWTLFDHDYHVAVIARRTSEREHSPPLPPADEVPNPEPHFVQCLEMANHEVVDGLGWVQDSDMLVRTVTAQGYWASPDEVPVNYDMTAADHFFDEELDSLAPDSEAYLLIMHTLPDGSYLLRRRSSIVGDMVSGARTASGEMFPLDDFRRP